MTAVHDSVVAFTQRVCWTIHEPIDKANIFERHLGELRPLTEEEWSKVVNDKPMTLCLRTDDNGANHRSLRLKEESTLKEVMLNIYEFYKKPRTTEDLEKMLRNDSTHPADHEYIEGLVWETLIKGIVCNYGDLIMDHMYFEGLAYDEKADVWYVCTSG
jgi:hypothetical protein